MGQFLLVLSPLLSQATLLSGNDLKLIQSKVTNGGQPQITLPRELFSSLNLTRINVLSLKKNPYYELEMVSSFLGRQGLPSACGVK